MTFNILDNVHFGMFVESLSNNFYNLPSRTFMNGTIVPVVYKACQDAVREMIKNVHHISLTTDAWKSFAKQSYITLTCHIIDDECKLHNFVLDTTEIKIK